MSDRVFLDTNVVVYAFDACDRTKQERAWAVLDELRSTGRVALSTQVLQEFYVTVVRKLERPLEAEDAERAVAQLARMHVHQIDTETVLAAVALCRREHISLWDALIVQAATESGCTRLLSEDLQHGRQFGPVRVENPFAPRTGMAEP
jgi:predicted nucleic acid-binding protein